LPDIQKIEIIYDKYSQNNWIGSMRFRNLDLNLLAAFDKLVQLKSVSRAAEELSITQSAMSNALNRLRQYFDDPLLVQIGRRMELTPRAETLVDPVRDILVRIDAAVTAPDFVPATSTRGFAMMVSDYSLHTLMPAFTRSLAQAAPHIRLDFKPQVLLPKLQLERGDADFLIAPAHLCSADHPSEFLLRDPFVCVMDADNPAARDMDEDRFLAMDHVLMRPPSPGQSFVDRELEALGIKLKIAVSTFSFMSLPDLVRGTDRVAILQQRLARKVAQAGGLALVKPPINLPPLEQHVQWHAMRSHDTALEWLRRQLHATAAGQVEQDQPE
jgi:LysR family nod box-dependent transcriptional activator